MGEAQQGMLSASVRICARAFCTKGLEARDGARLLGQASELPCTGAQTSARYWDLPSGLPKQASGVELGGAGQQDHAPEPKQS